MFKKNKLRFIIYVALLIILGAGIWFYTAAKIPDNYYLFAGQDVKFDTIYPVTSTVTDEKDDRYNLEVKIMGIIPVKNVSVRIVEDAAVIPGGEAFGVKFYTDGVIVVGLSDVVGKDAKANPAFEAGVRTGDIIKSVNNEKVLSNESLSELIQKGKGQAVLLQMQRQSLEYSVEVTPIKETESGEYKIGLWVRDSAAGIGTVTYYDPAQNTFAGLGHSICDNDTGEIMPLSSAEIVGVNITSVRKSESGLPGELKGTFNDQYVIGALYSNVEEGVFGNLVKNFRFFGDPVKIAFKQDVYEGAAKIRCCINGTDVQEYDIEIIKVNRTAAQKTKNMIIKVTDSRLLETSGGIVQGMSGSPILQDGHLVGAVTHVLINSPTEGYGIFIENMMAN